MNKAPQLYYLEGLIKYAGQTQVQINGRWVPARPWGDDRWRNRLQLAWWVFTGKCDAFYWPEGQ